MKVFCLTIVPILALTACSSGTPPLGTNTGTGSGTSGGGTATTGTTTGPLTVTFDTVDVHPAAKAALEQAGFPIPPIANGAYEIAMDGVTVTFSGTPPSATIVLTDAGVATITSTTGPYAFALTDDFLAQSALLGVIGVVRPMVSGLGDGGLPQPSCPEWAQLTTAVNAFRDAGVTITPDLLLDAGHGFADYLMPTGLEVNGEASPPGTSVTGAVAYAIPMSYAVMLNCAGNLDKTTRDTDTGEALVYVTDGSAPGQGNPVAGAVSALRDAFGTPPPAPTYYANDYSAVDTSGTDSTGVATYLGVSPASTTPPTIKINGTSLSFTQPYSISTQPNAFFSIVAYPH